MKRVLGFLFHSFIIILLTAVTQIGGILYGISLVVFRKSLLKRWIVFISVYVLFTFLVVPFIAPYFGREKIKSESGVVVHSFFTIIANRNYVVPELQALLHEVSLEVQKEYPSVELHCLDANFPFFDGFPLLPHLSHNDGKKLDISLLYKDADGQLTNRKPSQSGYGVFVVPENGEYDQIEKCKALGYWQYDFPKYLTFGRSDEDIIFSATANKRLLSTILQRKDISKVFVEPHLSTRMKLQHPKLRYHGCQAVRHDDHIHLQVR